MNVLVREIHVCFRVRRGLSTAKGRVVEVLRRLDLRLDLVLSITTSIETLLDLSQAKHERTKFTRPNKPAYRATRHRVGQPRLGEGKLTGGPVIRRVVGRIRGVHGVRRRGEAARERDRSVDRGGPPRRGGGDVRRWIGGRK